LGDLDKKQEEDSVVALMAMAVQRTNMDVS
jgi:hypothetical protein